MTGISKLYQNTKGAHEHEKNMMLIKEVLTEFIEELKQKSGIRYQGDIKHKAYIVPEKLLNKMLKEYTK